MQPTGGRALRNIFHIYERHVPNTVKIVIGNRGLVMRILNYLNNYKIYVTNRNGYLTKSSE